MRPTHKLHSCTACTQDAHQRSAHSAQGCRANLQNLSTGTMCIRSPNPSNHEASLASVRLTYSQRRPALIPLGKPFARTHTWCEPPPQARRVQSVSFHSTHQSPTPSSSHTCAPAASAPQGTAPRSTAHGFEQEAERRSTPARPVPCTVESFPPRPSVGTA